MASSVTDRTEHIQSYPKLKQFTTREFHAMIEAGVFQENDRVELIDGEITEMTAIGKKHVVCARQLTTLFARNLPEDIFLDVQNPLRLTEKREYYPDLMLLKNTDNSARNIAAPGDVLLAVEVSDSTLAFDRTVKLPSYAEAGVPEVWIIDLRGERVLTHREPLDGVYGRVAEVKRDGTLKVLALGSVVLRVSDIF